jgi:hypothetical protein
MKHIEFLVSIHSNLVQGMRAWPHPYTRWPAKHAKKREPMSIAANRAMASKRNPKKTMVKPFRHPYTP